MTCMFSVIHCCLQMYLKALEINVMKFMNVISLILSPPELALQAYLRKTGVRLELLTYIDALLMVEEGNRGEICQTISRYAKTNNKYMNGCDKKKKKKVSYLMI